MLVKYAESAATRDGLEEVQEELCRLRPKLRTTGKTTACREGLTFQNCPA